MVGWANGNGAAVGGVVVVTVAPVDMPPTASVATVPVPVPVPVCSSFNATASTAMTTMALAPISADSSLTVFCWLGSTLTTPIALGWFSDPRRGTPGNGHESYAYCAEKTLRAGGGEKDVARTRRNRREGGRVTAQGVGPRPDLGPVPQSRLPRRDP